MRTRILYLLRIYATTILLFIVAKVVFMLCYGSNHDMQATDYLSVVRHGLSLDLSTALYFLIVPFLVCLLSVWFPISRWVLRIYYGVVAFAFALAFVADTSLYAFWGFKLDSSCLQYLSQPSGITQSVSVGYLLLRLLMIVLLTIGIYWLYTFRTEDKHHRSLLNSNHEPLRLKMLQTAFYVCLMPMIVVGIRGGLTESTTNIGQVYFSQNQFLNHSAVNPVFSFLYSATHQLGDLSQYHFMDEEKCHQLVSDVYTTSSINCDTLLNCQRPHVLVVLLESCGEEFASVMPRLQQLKNEGINFSQCYGNTWRTDRGTICVLSGYPSFPGISVMKMPEKSRRLPGIARTLKGQGYATSYVYGGDINFTNMRSYLISNGWERLTSMDDYSYDERHSAQWGVRDDITFETIYQQILKLQPQQPQLMGYSTLSSHEPWDVPVQRHDDEILNAFAYLDDCLGNFIDKVRATPAWNQLLIVLTADHGISYKNIDRSKPLAMNHIPMLWLGGAIKEPRTIDVLCNQSDLPATLLGQLQLPHDDFLFSRDVLSATYTYPTAVHNYYNAQLLIDSTGHILYDFDARRYIVEESTNAERLLNVNKAILQYTTADLQQ
ncbi:MAG: LTA synthase family protein [Prevotella sp.]|nr:LTA synthase family protein [Prevotella sp.]